MENSVVSPWQMMGGKYTGTSQKIFCADRSPGSLRPSVCKHTQLNLQVCHVTDRYCSYKTQEFCISGVKLRSGLEMS